MYREDRERLEPRGEGRKGNGNEGDVEYVDPWLVSLLLLAIKLTLKTGLKAVLRFAGVEEITGVTRRRSSRSARSGFRRDDREI